jgi:signal transduction histidine kinase
MVVLVLLALLLAQGISLWLMSNAHRKAIEGHSQRFVLRQLASVVELLESSPVELHPKILAVWRRPGMRFSFSHEPRIAEPATPAELQLVKILRGLIVDSERLPVHLQLQMAEPELVKVRQQQGPWESEERYRNERHRERGDGSADSQHFRPFGDWRGPPPTPVERMDVAVQLRDGHWLQLVAEAPPVPLLAASHTIIFVLLASVLVLLVLVWHLRHITRPLAQLAVAASQLGRGEKVSPLPECGPEDVQVTIRAFNDMYNRVERFVADRTHMLAALSHDLRTPMTSMRLRLEMMGESPERERLLASLDEMQQMSEATLAFIRESGDTEAAQTVDLTALLSSLCDDLSDLGLQVNFEYREQLLLRCRPLSLKRALRNVVENAVKYGQEASVSLSREGDSLRVVVQDRGPGIDPAQIERVFEPFFRAETSRNRKTGGVGLGLSIARLVVTNHGGHIVLRNTHPGLRVEITLPRR